MDKKTILILCILGDPASPPASYHRTGGFNVDTAELIDYFRDSHYNLAVITNTSKYCDKLYELHNDYTEIFRIELSHDIMDNQRELANKYNYFWEHTLKIINDNNICPVFIHSFYWYSGYLGSKLSSYLNIPFIHSVVALAADKDKAEALSSFSVQLEWEKSFLHKASLILAITQSEKNTLMGYYNIPDTKCIIVGRNVSSDFEAPHNEMGVCTVFKTSNSYTFEQKLDRFESSWWNSGAFLYMGRINHEKGVDIIIYAWYILYLRYNGKVPPLWLAGGDPVAINSIRNKLIIPIKELEKLENENKICWWGYLNPPAISTLLMKSLALIMHSQYESGGRIIIEAFSQSRPVIATPTGFGKDFIRNWENGFLVPFGDIKCLIHKMDYFIKQPLLTKTLGQVAYQYHLEIQKMWDSKNKHLIIYKLFSESNYNKKTYFPEDFYDCTFSYPTLPFGKISTYPYGYQERSFYEKCIKKTYEEKQYSLLYDKNTTNKSYIWYMQEAEYDKYVIKAVYSMLNLAKIWNNQSCKEVISINEAMERLLLCNKCKNCVPINSIISDRCITMNYIDKKTIKNYSVIEFRRTISLSYEFNTSEISDVNADQLLPFWICGNKSDLQHILKEIANPFTASSELFLEFINTNYNYIHKLFIDAQNLSEHKAINYGNDIIEHIMTEDGFLYLLPSRYVYCGPLGMDAGQIFVEYCLMISYDDTILSELIIIISEIYDLTPIDIIAYIKTNILIILRKNAHLGFDVEDILKLWDSIKLINIQ